MKFLFVPPGISIENVMCALGLISVAVPLGPLSPVTFPEACLMLLELQLHLVEQEVLLFSRKSITPSHSGSMFKSGSSHYSFAGPIDYQCTTTCWGAHLDENPVRGTWSLQERLMSSNLRETHSDSSGSSSYGREGNKVQFGKHDVGPVHREALDFYIFLVKCQLSCLWQIALGANKPQRCEVESL